MRIFTGEQKYKMENANDKDESATAKVIMSRPFRERGPNEFLKYYAGPNAILDIHDYEKFRSIGPAYLWHKFGQEEIEVPEPLIGLLLNAASLLGYFEKFPPQNGEVEVLKYCTAITIWSYLTFAGFVKDIDGPAITKDAEPQKYYSVRQGRCTGVYLNLSDAEEQIKWFPNADYEAFNRIEKAEQYLNGNDAATKGLQRGPNEQDVCTWAHYSKDKNGITIRTLKLRGRIFLINKAIPVETPVDVAEFLALAATLKFCTENGIGGKIYSTNLVALSWVKNLTDGPVFSEEDLPGALLGLINQAVDWLKVNRPHNSYGGWDYRWGDMFEFINGE